MNKFGLRIGILVYLLAMTILHAQVNVRLPLTFTAENWGGDDEYALGINENATEGLDDNLDVPAPPPPFLQAYAELDAPIGDTKLVEDFRPNSTSITYKLDLIFGFNSTNFNVTMSWNAVDFQAGSAFANANYDSAEIRDSSGALVKEIVSNSNVVTPTEVIFPGGSGEEKSFFIVLSQGEVNSPPDARDDSTVTFAGVGIDIDVLSNDFDAESGSNLTITNIESPTSQGGTATLNGNVIAYSPPAGNQRLTDTFTYTIIDNDQDNPETDTATVTVEVFDGNLIASRSHDAQLKIGDGMTADDGLVVTVTINYTGSVTALNLKEVLPQFDQFDDFYKIAIGNHSTGFDLGGTNPPDQIYSDLQNMTAYTQDATDVFFSWTTIPAPDANQDEIQFTYRIFGGENEAEEKDVMEKTISGEVNFAISNVDQDTVVLENTTFTPLSTRFHPADTNTDCRVTALEKNIYIGTAVAIVQQGPGANNFQYHFDESIGNFQPGPPPGGGSSSQMHPADTNGDGRVTALEKNIFIGTAVAIVQQGPGANNFTYRFDESIGNFQPGGPTECE